MGGAEKRINIVEKGNRWKRGNMSTLNIQEIVHPVDKGLIQILEKAHVKDVLNAPLDQLVAVNYGPLLATGIPLDENNFPELYQLMKSTCKRLGIKIPYTVISNELNGINAFATGTDQNAFIVISNTAPRLLSPKELQFIISHECGHIAMEHMVYHTAGNLAVTAGGYVPIIGPVLAQTAVFPLNSWNRCSEITADRIGLICCDDLRTAQLALLRIIGGFTDVNDIDVDRYIAGSRAVQNRQPLGKLGEFFQSHPMIHKRLKALELFYNSEVYYRVIHRTPPEGAELLTADELNKKTDELLKIIS